MHWGSVNIELVYNSSTASYPQILSQLLLVWYGSTNFWTKFSGTYILGLQNLEDSKSNWKAISEKFEWNMTMNGILLFYNVWQWRVSYLICIIHFMIFNNRKFKYFKPRKVTENEHFIQKTRIRWFCRVQPTTNWFFCQFSLSWQ